MAVYGLFFRVCDAGAVSELLPSSARGLGLHVPISEAQPLEAYVRRLRAIRHRRCTGEESSALGSVRKKSRLKRAARQESEKKHQHRRKNKRSDFEGGSLIPNKSPGRVTFADVTLERGATVDRDLFDWLQDVVVTSSGLGLTDPYYKRNLNIVQQDRDGTTLRRWCLSRAWPTKFVAGEWDNEADENVIESVTLAHDFFELIQ